MCRLDTFDGQLGDLDTEDFLSRYLPMFLGKHFLLQDVHDLWYDIQGTNLVRTDDPGSFRLGEYKWHFPVRRAPGHPIRDGRHECVTTPLPVTCILSPSQLKQPHKNALETFAALPEEVREQFVVHATVTYKIMRKEAPAVPAPIAPAPAMPAPIAPAPVHQVQPLIIDDD